MESKKVSVTHRQSCAGEEIRKLRTDGHLNLKKASRLYFKLKVCRASIHEHSSPKTKDVYANVRRTPSLKRWTIGSIAAQCFIRKGQSLCGHQSADENISE